jgi:endonuclease/exonuclease/phosphatase (EEP) superfamily protein YafD
VLIAALCVVSVAGFGGHWHWLLDLTSHFRLHYAALLTVGLLVGWLCRVRGLWLALAAGCAAAQIGALLPFTPTAARAAAAAHAPAVRVLLANVYTGNRAYGEVADLIARENPDVVVLQETSQSWLDGLAETRLGFPNRIEEARPDNFGIAVWSRLRTANARIVRFGRAGVPSVICDLERDGNTLVLIATHPLPPAGGERSALRNDGLFQLARFAASEAAPVLVVGDLNCSPWSPHFRALLRDGRLRDSAVGRWPQATWPACLGPCGIPLDHVLHGTGLHVLDRRVLPRIGSDHLPLVAEVTWVRAH